MVATANKADHLTPTHLVVRTAVVIRKRLVGLEVAPEVHTAILEPEGTPRPDACTGDAQPWDTS